MDSLPLEILQHIFALACTDGGLTGCSLTLTSKAVRAAVRVGARARLDSFVDLYARECNPTLGDTPKVQHLHLVIPPSLGPRRFICGGVLDTPNLGRNPNSNPGPPKSSSALLSEAQLAPPVLATPTLTLGSSRSTSRSISGIRIPSSLSVFPASTSSPVEPISSHQTIEDGGRSPISQQAFTPGRYTAVAPSDQLHVDSASLSLAASPHSPIIVIPQSPNDNEPQQIVYSPEYREMAHALARLVAPHLETLVIQRGFRCQIRLLTPALAFLDVPFPRVREVALLGLSEAGELVVPHAADDQPLFPAVTHIHLVRKGLAGHDCINFWRVHAPRATHLRISCLRAPFGKFMPSLANSVGIAHLPDLLPPQGRTYPTLRAIILHRDSPTEAEQERIAVLEAYSLLGDSLTHFKHACPDQGVTAAVDPPFYMHFEEWGARLREEWLERIVGGPGCWKELELSDKQGNMGAA